jgi:phosphohistidine phosphatase
MRLVMKLYILRHADAEIRDTEKFPDDALRPLTKKGINTVGKVVAFLNAAGIKLDLILSSPTVRTLDTSKGIRKGLKIPKEKLIPIDALRPEGTRGQLISEINESYNVDALMIVGHEPNLSMLISQLINGDETLSIHMKKAGLCCLTIDNWTDGKCAVLEWLLDPNLL